MSFRHLGLRLLLIYLLMSLLREYFRWRLLNWLNIIIWTLLSFWCSFMTRWRWHIFHSWFWRRRPNLFFFWDILGWHHLCWRALILLLKLTVITLLFLRYLNFRRRWRRCFFYRRRRWMMNNCLLLSFRLSKSWIKALHLLLGFFLNYGRWLDDAGFRRSYFMIRRRRWRLISVWIKWRINFFRLMSLLITILIG